MPRTNYSWKIERGYFKSGKINTFASATIMMTFLTTVVRHVVSLGTFWEALPCYKLPPIWARNTLISPWTTTGHAAQVTFGASSNVTVVPVTKIN